MTEPASPPTATPHSRSRLVLVPALVFAALALLFAFALKSGDPSKLPSALIGKPAPEMVLAPMEGLREGELPVPGFDTAMLRRGEATVVNFFASWCVPCVQEHPMLTELRARTGVRIVGINYKDPTPGGRRFLGRYGNPYAVVGVDDTGRAAIEWGVYGMPETFIVAGDGRIALKHVGPITPQALEARILPALEALKK